MGRRYRNPQLTPLELEIMKVLWEAAPATVQAVQERLPGEPKLAYTTVQTMLNVLHRKRKVKRTLKGKAYEYQPKLSRQKAVSAALHDIIQRLFGGSAESLVMSLVESRYLSPRKLTELNRLLEKPRETREESDGNN